MTKFRNLILAVLAVFAFTQCDVDNNPTTPQEKKGSLQMKMTDAPIDDANVQSAVVTITEVRIDGEAYEGFSGKTTIDLLTLQNGNVKALGLSELEVGSYSEISVVLDHSTDANGNMPGCYVQTVDGVKHELQASASSTQELVIAKAFEIKENETTDIVIDFDVRKAITTEANATADNKYEFVTKTELEAALRTVVEAETGKVEGQVEDNFNGSDKIVVYLYKQGEFNESVETQGQGASNIEFKNAVTSALVDANGNYTLSFVNEGDYEVHYAAYEAQADGSMEFKGMLSLDILGLIGSSEVSVSAGVSASISATIFGILP